MTSKLKQTSREITLDETPFLKSLLKLSSQLILDKHNKPREVYTRHDYYLYEILNICLQIHSLFHILKHSRLFLGERIIKAKKNDSNISNSDFCRYHIETYLLRITTFKDLVLKLISKTLDYDLKIHNLRLESNLVKKLNSINDEKIILLIEELNVLLKKMKPIRDRIAHGGYFDNPYLALMQSNETFKSKKDKTLEQTWLNKFIADSIIEMYDNEKAMMSYTIKVFKNLMPQRKLIQSKYKIDSEKIIPSWEEYKKQNPDLFTKK